MDTPPRVKFLWLFGGSEVRLPDSAKATPLCRRFYQYALPLLGRLTTVPNFTNSMLMLFFVQPLFRNSVINCQAL